MTYENKNNIEPLVKLSLIRAAQEDTKTEKIHILEVVTHKSNRTISEKITGDKMCLCVSRAKEDKIVLEL